MSFSLLSNRRARRIERDRFVVRTALSAEQTGRELIKIGIHFIGREISDLKSSVDSIRSSRHLIEWRKSSLRGYVWQ